MKDGRDIDIADIQNAMRRETDPAIRKRMHEAARKIADEPARIRQMREQLIRAKRDGKDQEVRDINEVAMTDERWR